VAVKKPPVIMRLCIRVAGNVKCRDEGYYARYETQTVGPVDVDIKYPE